jgi:hypothetical protein
MPNFGQYSLSLFLEDKDMYSGESQQFLCLAGYRPPCLRLRAFHSTTGKQFWHEEIPIQLSGPVGALVVSDGVLYRPHTSPWEKRPNLFAMSKQDGRELWSTQLSYDDLRIRLSLCSDTTGADCKDIFRTCLFNKERGKKCRATT